MMGDGRTYVVLLWETRAMSEQNALARLVPAPNNIAMDEVTKHCKTRKGFVDSVELAYVPYGYHASPRRQGIRSFFQ
jgi:hypothetical protein